MSPILPDTPPERPQMLERAFELARAGACRTLPELATRLKRERYEQVDAHLAGPSLRRDLNRLFEAARDGAGRQSR